MGVALDWQSKLIVILACGRSLSQRFMGKSGAMPARKMKMRFEVTDGYFHGIPAVASGGGLIHTTSCRCR